MKDDPPIEFDRAQFLRDRREMLLALDVPMMREYARKYGARVSTDDAECLYAMHLARTYVNEIPVHLRQVSLKWLRAHGRPDKMPH